MKIDEIRTFFDEIKRNQNIFDEKYQNLKLPNISKFKKKKKKRVKATYRPAREQQQLDQ